jgi:hypothetical protein
MTRRRGGGTLLEHRRGDEPCLCGHQRRMHVQWGIGPCRGLDSYGVPCTCPSVELYDTDGQ